MNATAGYDVLSNAEKYFIGAGVFSIFWILFIIYLCCCCCYSIICLKSVSFCLRKPGLIIDYCSCFWSGNKKIEKTLRNDV